MKICAACSLELPKESFDNKQWELKLHQRRCAECISVERVAQLTAPECWICREDEAEKRELLRRDCSCRGTDAGFVHLSCLVKYAKKKNQECDDRDQDGRDFGGVTEPWEVCPNCKQDYQNALSVDIANEFVSFVEREHPTNMQKQVEALYLKLWSLRESLKPKQIDEAKEVAARVLILIRQMKVETPILPTRYMQVEACTYNDLGHIALSEGKEESAKEALLHFEKYLELCKAIGFAEGIANAEYNIACAKSKYDRCDVHNEVQLKKPRDLYELRVVKHGEGNAFTINEGMNLAIVLWNAKRVIEAERLLTCVAAVSRRVHGPNHKLTKNAESHLQDFKVREALVQFEGDRKHFHVLQYEADVDEYVIQGPIAKPRNIHTEKIINIAANGILSVAGTPVVCRGLKDDSSHLNGKVADLRFYCDETDRYEVHFEDKCMGSCMVKLENIRILFNLPEVVQSRLGVE